MGPKYPNGIGVRIRIPRDRRGKLKYPELKRYHNETGTIMNSAFLLSSAFQGTQNGEGSDKTASQPIYTYIIRLDKGVDLTGLLDDCLEALN